jgi:hypothetical protein
LFGIKAVPGSVEVDASQGLPGFTLVGLPDNAVRESRERVVSAIRSIGKVVTGFRTTVNLSPADLRKEGSALDLPLAIGLLVSTGEIEVPQLDRYVFVGELSLDGLLKPVRGVLSIAMNLSTERDCILVIPRGNVQEASLVEGLRFICADSLGECVEILERNSSHDVKVAKGIASYCVDVDDKVPDFKNVVGMDGVKRALEIAAAALRDLPPMHEIDSPPVQPAEQAPAAAAAPTSAPRPAAHVPPPPPPPEPAEYDPMAALANEKLSPEEMALLQKELAAAGEDANAGFVPAQRNTDAMALAAAALQR